MKLTALIMAGGRGERFWPKSRKDLPKQFLCLTDENRTMIQCTVDRLLPIIPIEDIFIATGEGYRGLVHEQLPDLPESNILCEPVGKNTAPCIGLGAVHMRKRYGDATMIVLPSDHLIAQKQLFRSVLKKAAEVAQKTDALVTLGISPTSPDTGYGYIQYDAEAPQVLDSVFRVSRFVEKPNLEIAQKYVASGDYLWNSGMFIWKVSTILKYMEEYLPENYELLNKIEATIGTDEQEAELEKNFNHMKSISIDYGIMEKVKDIYILPASFGWDDVGSWLAVGRVNPMDDNGSVVRGDVITIDTKRCIVRGNQKLIAMIGVRDMIVVDTEDALLLCEKTHAGEIKKVLEVLRTCNRTELL